MAEQKRISDKEVRKMVRKPFSSRIRTDEGNKERISWVWEGDNLVPVSVSRSK